MNGTSKHHTFSQDNTIKQKLNKFWNLQETQFFKLQHPISTLYMCFLDQLRVEECIHYNFIMHIIRSSKDLRMLMFNLLDQLNFTSFQKINRLQIFLFNEMHNFHQNEFSVTLWINIVLFIMKIIKTCYKLQEFLL